jgi:hypothetical protein
MDIRPPELPKFVGLVPLVSGKSVAYVWDSHARPPTDTELRWDTRILVFSTHRYRDP